MYQLVINDLNFSTPKFFEYTIIFWYLWSKFSIYSSSILNHSSKILFVPELILILSDFNSEFLLSWFLINKGLNNEFLFHGTLIFEYFWPELEVLNLFEVNFEKLKLDWVSDNTEISSSKARIHEVSFNFNLE